MASSTSQPRTLLASELVAFTEAQLDQYMKDNTWPDGTISIGSDLIDPENVPDSFLERLR
jgi:hypothetical protein